MKKRLKDIADIRVGYQFRGKVVPDPSGTVQVIQIKDTTADFKIKTDELVPVSIDRPTPYLTQLQDVLFLSRGHRLYACVVPKVPANTIATGYFFILRPRPAVMMPEFLAWSLNHPDFQELIRPFHRGSHIPMVSRSDIENLKIQVPSFEVQEQVLTLNGLLDRERHLTATIQEKRTLLVQAIARNLMESKGSKEP